LKTIPPSLFKSHLRVLKQDYQVLSLKEVIKRLKGHIPFSERDVLITFDDGYLDNYQFATPLLLDAGLTAVVFLLAGAVGRNTVLRTEAKPVEERFLSEVEIKEMQRAGIEFGSHGISHRPLALLSYQEAEEEVFESRKVLKSILGDYPLGFSFPWGRRKDFNGKHVEMVSRAGYECAFTMLNGFNPASVDPFLLRRTHLYQWDDEKLFAELLDGRLDGWSLKNW